MSTLAAPEQRSVGAPADAPAESRRPPADGGAGRRGAFVLGLRLLALAIGFGTSVLLARWLGPDGLGVYEQALGWAALLSVAAGLGADRLVVREVAKAHAQGRFDVVRGIAKASAWAVAASAGVVAAGVAIVALLWDGTPPAGLLLMACGLVPVAALLRVRQAVLQGLAQVVTSQLAELVVAPAALLALLAALVLTTGALTPTAALVCHVSAFAVALLLVVALLRRRTPAEVRAAAPTYALRGWARALLPIAAITGLQALNGKLDVVLLGALSTDGEVGRFACANRLATLAALPLLAANAALGPAFARLHATGDRSGLQRTVTRAARWTFAAALPVGLGMLLFGEVALAMFGDGFAAGRGALRLLAAAQLVNVAFGSVGLLLMMTGNMRPATLGLLLGAVVNAALDALLIPGHGALGAAIATAAGLVVWNASHALAVRRRLGVVPGVFGPLRGEFA